MKILTTFPSLSTPYLGICPKLLREMIIGDYTISSSSDNHLSSEF